MNRLLSTIFGIPFLGGGITMLFLLWGDKSGFPPLPMKLFGTFVCVPVALVGAAIIFKGLFGKK